MGLARSRGDCRGYTGAADQKLAAIHRVILPDRVSARLYRSAGQRAKKVACAASSVPSQAVIATSSSDEKLEKMKRLGADDVIHYKSVPDWGEKARALTDGRGVDHVIEVAGPATFAQSMAACRLGGHIAVIGLLSGVMAEVNIPALFSGQIRVSGVSIGSRADQEDMIRAIGVNRIEPVIDRSFALEGLRAAFEYFQTQRQFGKVAIEISGAPA
jgi:NADPH:quinone reductase-like Zn-dependent oxidoreductase